MKVLLIICYIIWSVKKWTTKSLHGLMRITANLKVMSANGKSDFLRPISKWEHTSFQLKWSWQTLGEPKHTQMTFYHCLLANLSCFCKSELIVPTILCKFHLYSCFFRLVTNWNTVNLNVTAFPALTYEVWRTIRALADNCFTVDSSRG